MPEPPRREKYVLLEDESEGEADEFNKGKMSFVDSGATEEGRKYTASKVSRCSAWCHPQWICQSFFIFILLTSQLFLFLCVLKQHWEIEMIKLEHTMDSKQLDSNQFLSDGNREGRNENSKHKPEDLYKIEEIGGSVSQDKPSKNGSPTKWPGYNLQDVQMMDQRINIIQESIIHFKQNLNLLQARCEGLTDRVENKPTGNQDLSKLYGLVHRLNESTLSSLLVMRDEIYELRNVSFNLTYKFRTTEISLHSLIELTKTQTTELDQLEESLERLFNISENLKSHQGQLEQNLDSNFRQISHLRDMVYQGEDGLNRTGQPISTMVHFQTESTTDNSQQMDSSKITWFPRSPEDDVKPGNYTSSTEGTLLTTTSKHVIWIPSVTSLRALRSFFYEADWTGRGSLTYEDLVNNLGMWAPPQQEIKKFDENNDGRFSYVEMINALGLQE